MPKSSNHTHKLQRVRFKSGNAMFMCVLDCSYKISPPLALGKKMICHRCGDEFILNEYSIRLAKPHCEKCHVSKSVPRSKITVNGEELAHTIITNDSPLHSDIVDIVDVKETLAERLSKTIKDVNAHIEEDI